MPQTDGSAQYTENALRSFYDRRHPMYLELIEHWRFLFETYRGGRHWFENHIHKYHKEGTQEYKNRLDRAYRFNHTREVVDLVQKYLFKGHINRNTDEAPETVTAFWKAAMRGGAGIKTLMREASVKASIGGRTAIVVDNNFPSNVDEEGNRIPVSISAMQGHRVYAYCVPVTDILDYAWDEDGDGELLWIKLREWVRDDTDPFEAAELVEPRVRLWTRDSWYLYQEVDEPDKTNRPARGKENPKEIRSIGSGKHDLGEVPVRLLDNTISADPYNAPSLIEDIAYLDRAVANYLSNLDAIIQDQTFSQLAIPAQGLNRGDDAYKKVLEMGTKRIFTYDAGMGSDAAPRFISPDPKQAGVILSVINKIINEIYHTVGLAGERTKEDNSVGIDNSSGVAKAYDFERVNSLLTSKAAACEEIENWMVRIVQKWHGAETVIDDLVSYPEGFDVLNLQDELTTAEALGKINAPEEVRRHHMRQLVEKLFPQLKKDIKEGIIKAISEWQKPEESDAQPSGDPVSAPNRQGQVTRDTPD
jgi:hypothetical protein